MNKQTYITPEMEVMNIEAMEMIATSFGFNEEGGDDSSLSIGRGNRRGTWGNLWATEE